MKERRTSIPAWDLRWRRTHPPPMGKPKDFEVREKTENEVGTEENTF